MTSISDQQSKQQDSTGGANPAADLIRQKLDSLYTTEPSALEEAKEIIGHSKQLSKHQSYMKNLTESGMALAEIQTAWHNYYQSLSDTEKHEVWNEFYKEHGQHLPAAPKQSDGPVETKPPAHSSQIEHHKSATHARVHKAKDTASKTVADIKKQLLEKSSTRTAKKLSAKQHFQSILFGVGMGSLVVLVLLVGLFNERFIAPFITPSRQVTDTPIIIDSDATVTGTKVVIPKINVEIPVVYDEPSVEEKALQNALERGVVHYASTASPGEKGNAVIFGHSSNNILNKGQYKFAFVLLSKLENGDVFYLTKDGTRYAYRVYEKKIVKPTDLGVLGATDKPATATLITCDPPGTSLNRLVVIGEQISPEPGANKASTAVKTDEKPAIIPSNAPSLWQRIKDIFRS